MIPLQNVYIVIEPRDLDDTLPCRGLYQYDRLADELSRELPVRVQIVETWLRDAPRDGMLLVADHIAMHDSLIEAAQTAPTGLPRPILLGLAPGKVELAERARLAAVVVADRLARWKLGQEDRGPALFYGLKSLAPYLPPPFEPFDVGKESATHMFYRCNDAGSLPAILARYIEAYWQHGTA
jgi:hypothetical protein